MSAVHQQYVNHPVLYSVPPSPSGLGFDSLAVSARDASNQKQGFEGMPQQQQQQQSPVAAKTAPGEAPPEALSEVEALRQQLREKEKVADKLAGTLSHYRSWAANLQARYQAFSPEAARPARRIYVGGLPPEGSLTLESNRSSLESTATNESGAVAMQFSPSGPSRHSSGDGANLPLKSSQLAKLPGHAAFESLGPDSRKGSGGSSVRVNKTAAYASQLEADLRQYVNNLLIKAGGCAAPGYPITSCKVYPDKWYAFLEFRSVEEASNCMALDGITYLGHVLRVRRPNNYDPDVAIMLGVTEPDPSMDISPHGLVRTVVPDTPHKLFLGGLPCDWTEDQVKELLLPFGSLRAFNLVQDKTTGNSKGYAFCEYVDVSRTDTVIQALNAKQLGKRFLTAKRAVTPAHMQQHAHIHM